MPASVDGPASPLFAPIRLSGRVPVKDLARAGVSKEMVAASEHAPSGNCVSWGIPFKIGRLHVLKDKPVTTRIDDVRARWLVFLHTSDVRPLDADANGFISPMRGAGQLFEHAADYVIEYADGSKVTVPIHRRHEIGALGHPWGENCVEAVAHCKPAPIPAGQEQMQQSWGWSQTRAKAASGDGWVNWLFAWENPHPRKKIVRLRLEPVSGVIVLSAVSAGRASSLPVRWGSRSKALLTLPKGTNFNPTLDEKGRLGQLQLDMGQVISATPRPVYPNRSWGRTYNNQLPTMSDRQILVEYTAHADARFHLHDGRTVPVAKLNGDRPAAALCPVAPATQLVGLRVVEKGTNKPVAVKLHVHGESDEYLPPNDRHRLPNPAWFEDYSTDFLHDGKHWCTYFPGETSLRLPLGRVYIEVSKGFEIKPVRKSVRVTRSTDQIVVEIDRTLPWRENGWVSADTHVHFLSPQTALLEGAGEGVNVVNLLASQWGELMTNVGDFDGKTTFGSKEAGGDGEYLVRVGTENRQHVLGHISLLGYHGNLIGPMTTGGPDESALGDPIEVLLTEWARQCRDQNGVVVIPHFPNPRLENAATIISGDADAVEMTSWGALYAGIDPYSLSDWYRYLNCGYLVAAVGGTDKMSATTAVGTVRTYARVLTDRGFTFEAWKDAIRRGETFVTYGPLMEFAVEGRPAGSRIEMKGTGGTVDVEWELASVTMPMSRLELVVNGEIRESVAIDRWAAKGSWSVDLDRSSWLALLVRGHYADQPEVIAAHSSPVMVQVGKTPFFAGADAMTILDQIEGALAYLDTVGTRAENKAYKRMRMVLTSAHRALHNRMHQAGVFHQHTTTEDHAEHH